MRRLLITALALVACRGSEMPPSAGPLAAVSFAGCDGVSDGGTTVGSTQELKATLATAQPSGPASSGRTA